MEALAAIFELLSYVVLGEALLSWVQSPHDTPRKQLSQFTEPLYAPIRQVIDPQKTGGLDLSPLVYIFGFQILASMCRASAY